MLENSYSIPILSHPWPEIDKKRAMIMGIVNVTPDSFSDGGDFLHVNKAVEHALQLIDDGADILDIGGESSRPGSNEISAEEEIERVIPVIKEIRRRNSLIPISIDSYKAETARVAIEAGANIVNDIWGLQKDSSMAQLVKEADSGLVIMHNRTTKDPGIDIMRDVEDFFHKSLEIAQKAGIKKEKIVLDPGIGFGKTFEQNLVILRSLSKVRALGFPVLLGLSRKSFLGIITKREVKDREAASIAANCYGIILGVEIIRVHNVGYHKDAIDVISAIKY